MNMISFLKKLTLVLEQKYNYFKKIMNFVGQMLTQANIQIENNSIKISSLDQGHVALVNMCIPTEFFSTFNFKRTILVFTFLI